MRLPIGINLDGFQKDLEAAKSHTRQTTQFVLKQFSDMNASLGGPAAAGIFAGYGSTALRLVGVFAAVTATVKLMGDAIQATRDRLVEIIEVADKATARGLSPEFFQAFIAGAKGAEDKVAALEAALDHAFQATKPLLNPNWTVWDDGLLKVSAVAKAMQETRELFTTDQNFSGFDLFKNAKDQDSRIKAVLIYMQQLKAIGQDLAALDVGEKMFGAKWADEIRLGKESVDHILQTIDTGSKIGFVSNEAAKNAKELDDRLNDAWATISQKLKPDWDDLANIALRIKNAWTSIIEAVANYKTSDVTARPLPGVNAVSDQDARNNPDLESAAFGNPAILAQYRKRRGFAPDISPAAPIDESRGLNMAYREGVAEVAPDGVPMPRRRPSDAPAPPPAAAAAIRDPLEVSIDQITKRIAVINAETATIGQATDARARATTVAQLEEAAKRANSAAGMANTAVTSAQRAEIDKTADAMLRAAGAAEKARVQDGIKSDRDTALLGEQDVRIANQLKGLFPDVATALASVEASAMRVNDTMRTLSGTIQGSLVGGLTDIFDHTKSAGQGFADMGRTVLRAIEEMVIKIAIVEPLMRGLQSMMGGGFSLGSVLLLPGAADFIGPVLRAGGGVISGPGTGTSDSIPARLSDGEFVVNSRSTSQNRALLEAINAGQLRGFATGGLVSDLAVPSGAMSGGGSTMNVSPTINVSVEGGSRGPQADAAMGAQLAKTVSDSIKGMIAQELRTQSRPGGTLRS